MMLAAFSMCSLAWACKDRQFPDHFPVAELSDYDNVLVIHLVTVTLAKPQAFGAYTPPFSFEATISKVLKGPLESGSSISGVTSTGEEAMARCPVNLVAGGHYLVMLRGKDNPLILPRYGSLYTRSDDEHFEGYVADISRYYASGRP
jgi:hypothetical protein